MLVTKTVRLSLEILVIFLVLSSLLTLTETQAAQRYCGKTLTEIMKIVCHSGFNGKPLKRAYILNGKTFGYDYNSLAKDIMNLNISNTSKSLQHPETAHREQTLAAYNPNHLMAKFLNGKRTTMIESRQRRLSSSGGIYYECCLNKCTTSEMSAYCL